MSTENLAKITPYSMPYSMPYINASELKYSTVKFVCFMSHSTLSAKLWYSISIAFSNN